MSLLENICSHCALHSIKELQLEHFTDALIHFKEDEKYSSLLSDYDFNEKKISNQLVDDIANLLHEEKIMYIKSDNSIFITMNSKQINEVFNKIELEESKLIHELLNDYRLFNTQKSLVK